MLKKKVLLAGFSAAKPSWYCLEASPVYCFETLYVLALASSNFSINENNMFSALSDYSGYLSLLNFFLRSSYKKNYGKGICLNSYQCTSN